MKAIKHDPTKKPITPEAVASPQLYVERFREEHFGMDPNEWRRFQQSSGAINSDRSYLAEAVMLGSGISNALKVPLTSLLKKGITKRDVILRQLAAALGLDAVEQIVQESIPEEG